MVNKEKVSGSKVKELRGFEMNKNLFNKMLIKINQSVYSIIYLISF